MRSDRYAAILALLIPVCSMASMPPVAECPPAAGRVLVVGPGEQFTTVRAAAKAAQHGDTVHIRPGDYRGDVATWSANGLTICGIGGRARLYADGAHEARKGIWVITGNDTTVVNVDFHDAKVRDKNGAGIRQEGRNLTVRNSGFYDNQNGILTGNNKDSTITIESSEFARNGHGDGQSHNLYVGSLSRLVVRASYFREAKIGHQLKSRARENLIEGSYFIDGPNGTASYLLNFDGGGRAIVRGNLLHKGPNADNPVLISHLSNTWGPEYNAVTLEHNTLVSTYRRGTYFLSVRTGATVQLTANIFAGTGKSTLTMGTAATERANVNTDARDFPGADDIERPAFWPGARLLPRLALPAALVSDYEADSPRPFELRALTGPARRIGALQSPP